MYMSMVVHVSQLQQRHGRLGTYRERRWNNILWFVNLNEIYKLVTDLKIQSELWFCLGFLNRIQNGINSDHDQELYWLGVHSDTKSLSPHESIPNNNYTTRTQRYSTKFSTEWKGRTKKHKIEANQNMWAEPATFPWINPCRLQDTVDKTKSMRIFRLNWWLLREEN
jgi:hypothetical protein